MTRDNPPKKKQACRIQELTDYHKIIYSWLKNCFEREIAFQKDTLDIIGVYSFLAGLKKNSASESSMDRCHLTII